MVNVYKIRRAGITVVWFLCLLSGAGWTADQTVDILYIGNSLTFVNNMPGMVADLARAGGQDIRYEVVAPGGRRLIEHAQDPVVEQKIRERPWDFVVLQEQSQWPAFSPPRVAMYVFSPAKKLQRMIREANPKAKIVFYNTMARKNGDADNARFIPEMKTYAGMQNRINRSYLTMARDNQAVLAPVGQAWEEMRSQYPRLDLYADDVHPNVAGSYLTACVFYATFFGEPPFDLPHPAQIPAQTAEAIQDVVYRTVFLSAQTWDWSRGE